MSVVYELTHSSKIIYNIRKDHQAPAEINCQSDFSDKLQRSFCY